MGKVYLVGAGPGDAKLITVRGLELIKQADVIIYDFLANKDLLASARENAEIIYVGKQASRHELPQAKINALIAQKAKENEIIVRLKGGDPFIFGRGGEEALHLAEQGIEFEIVPGVTSAIAVPAYAGIPLTHREYASTVAFITGHEDEAKTASTIPWKELAGGPDTLVFLMGMKNLKDISRKLIEGGRNADTQACVIQWGTLPHQKVVTGALRDIDVIVKKEGLKPPGIIVVGDVVRLRDHLQWFEKRPFFGMKVVVTRAPHQSRGLGDLLTKKGAQVIYCPTIDITPIEPNDALSKVIDHLKDYFCIILTSPNGAFIFLEHLFRKGKDARTLNGVRLLPIGPATASLLESKGLLPDYMPQTFTSEGIVELLKGLPLEGKRFLLPRAEEAPDLIAEYIRKHGGVCDVIPIYKTSLPQKPAPLVEKPHIITFTSSSTVTNFITLYGKEILLETLVASIGPVTAETLEKHGVPVHIQAETYDIPGLVEAIQTYMAK